MNKRRTWIGGLVLSAGTLVTLVSHEGYTDKAVIPVKGDVPTYGFGMPHRADGSSVRMGDKTNPVEALQRSLAHIQKDERGIKQCVTAPLLQGEYDLMVEYSYQYGVKALCKSSMVARANAGDYAGSCEAYKLYRFVGKGADRYDCSTTIDGRPNKRCWGVWKRSLERTERCKAAA